MIKYILTAVIILCLIVYVFAVSKISTIRKTGNLRPSDAQKNQKEIDKLNKIKLIALVVLILVAIVTMML